jgi:hypothetical protein
MKGYLFVGNGTICLLSFFLSCGNPASQDGPVMATKRFQYICKYKPDSLKEGYHNDLFFLDRGNEYLTVLQSDRIPEGFDKSGYAGCGRKYL